MDTDLFSKEVLLVIPKTFLKVLLNPTPINEIVPAGQCGPTLCTQTSAHNWCITGLVGVLLAPVGVVPLISVSFLLALGNKHWFLNLVMKTVSFLIYLISS